MWSPTHIRVTVQRARNLQSKGRKGTNDAFVLIQMGKEKYQTTIKQKTIDPEWYEECDLTLIGRDSDVHLTVFHRNALGLDEFLGQTSVSLAGVESFDRPFTRWYQLQGKTEKSEEKCRGELEAKITFVVQRCNDTQSLNDLSFSKRKNSIKNFAVTMGHKIQKLPSRSVSLRHLDPRKRLQKIREKRLSVSSDPSSVPEDDDEDEDFSPVGIEQNASLYSSTLSLPQSAMVAPTQEQTTSGETHKKNTTLEFKSPAHGEWTNRVLAHIKESPLARSETNLMDALKYETPIVPVRKSKGTLQHNLRRHTLQLSEPPDLIRLTSNEKHDSLILHNIPPEVLQQFERMNHKELVLLAIRQQASLEKQRDKILDLENYLDNLLVRVMETTPRILQRPYISQSCSSISVHRGHA